MARRRAIPFRRVSNKPIFHGRIGDTAVIINEKFVLGEVFEIQIGEDVIRTKLQEILSDTEFVVLQPTIHGIPIRPGEEEYTFQFNRSNGCYSFRAKVRESFKKDNILLTKVERVSEIERSQRRQFYRLPILLDIVVDRGEGQEGEEQSRESRFCKGKTIDIAENSVAFTCSRPFEAGEKVSAAIKLTEADAILVSATVLRCTRADKSEPYNVVLIFDDLCEKERKILRRFVLQQQALILQRRK